MTSLRVRASARAMRSGAIAPVVASLPVSLRPEETTTVSTELLAVDGGVDWPQHLTDAVRQVKGALVIHPSPVLPDEVPLASSVPVVIDYRFASNPAVSTAASQFHGWPAEALVEVSALVREPTDQDRLLLDQLAILRRLGLPLVDLIRLTWTSHGYYLRGDAQSRTPVLLSSHVTSGAPPQLTVRGLATDVAVELTVPDPSTARPAVLTRTSDEGATTYPTIWETSHRAAWRRLHAAVTKATPVTDLIDLRADLCVAVHALPDR